MTYYIKNGNAYSVTSEANVDIRTELPAGTYSVMKSQQGYFLEKQADITVDHKIYGSAGKRADRIINTFLDRPASTGVVLQGEKGSGKTLLARLLSMKLKDQGIPTILVNSPFAGEPFNNFISSIEQPIMLFFDEFEKVYDTDSQSKLLTLLDGTHNGKKLFVTTLNEYFRVNEFLKNRPGRFYYSFKYEGLEEAEVREYCEDALKDTSKTNSIVSFASTFSKFNFDILKAIVEEMNRYNESVGEVVQYLNARPTDNEMRLEIVSYDLPVKEGSVVNKDLHPFNPFSTGFTVWADAPRMTAELNDDKALFANLIAGAYGEWSFAPGDLLKMDGGTFIFQNEEGTVTLKRRPPKENGLEKYYREL